MKADNQITVKGLVLNKPTATIKGVVYNWENDTALVEVIFQEEGANYKHSRSFEMNTHGEVVSPTEIREFIKNELTDFE
jgi:hypothetical protein